ncbi:MAG: hypothetical protein GY928_02235 [Colwellia sp.]|nr:hypothetical protein [Colwellia sp.]
MSTTELVNTVNPKDYGLEESKANEMVNGLTTTIAERQILEDAYVDVIDLEITKENIGTFKELRLKIRNNRTQGIEKWHKTNKAFYLAGGRFVDAIKNKEITVNEQMECKLLEAEKHFENLEKERIKQLQESRVKQLSEFIEDAHERELSSMDDDVWESFLATKKQQHLDLKEAELKRENERIAKEKAEAERIEKQRIENEKLKKEAELREKQIKADKLEADRKEKLRLKAEQKKEDERNEKLRIEALERAKIEKARIEKERIEKEKQEAILKKEREEKAKLEVELKAKKEAELKAEREKAKAEKLAKQKADELAKAPKKEKLNNWIDGFVMGTPIGLKEDKTVIDIMAKFEAFKTWAKSEIDSM